MMNDIVQRLRYHRERYLSEQHIDRTSILQDCDEAASVIVRLASALRRCKMPCEVGDTVWCTIRKNATHYRVAEGVVSELIYGEDMQLTIVVKSLCRGYWGATIFPTQEAAQAALDAQAKGTQQS